MELCFQGGAAVGGGVSVGVGRVCGLQRRARASGARVAGVRMAADSGPGISFEEYMKARKEGRHQGGRLDEVQKDLQKFVEADIDFDGGDSGGGVVGDGNMDLEDQHNSAGMLRGGFAEQDYNTDDQMGGEGSVKSAVSARVASAGANYFGRSTGYAEEVEKRITDEDRKHHRMDSVRAQQLENWHNQRVIHAQNRQRGESMYGGAESFTRSWDIPAPEPEAPAQNWGALTVDPSEKPTETFEMRANVGQASMETVKIVNPFCTYSPFRCVFTSDSSPSFQCEPEEGTMDRSDGDPTEILVRFRPSEPTDGITATLVFETEDFKFIYKFVGST